MEQWTKSQRGWSGTGEGPLAEERGLYLDMCVTEFLVTPLLMGPARDGLKSQSAPVCTSQS